MSGRECDAGSTTERGQTTLPAVGLALVLLTAVTALSIAMADAAITGADRTPDERRAAAAIADRLVAADGPLGDRANVLNESETTTFNGTELGRVAPPAEEYAVDVTLDGERIARSGDPASGTTIRRLVLLERPRAETLEPDGSTATIPRRAGEATVTISPADGTTIRTVRANDRVVLHNESGLSGTFQIALVPGETTRLRFQTFGVLPPDAIRIVYDAPRTIKATLSVTVDA